VTVTTARGSFTRQADEALGSRIVPLDDGALEAKFLDLVGPVLGTARANALAEQLWSIEAISDVAPLVESMAKPAWPAALTDDRAASTVGSLSHRERDGVRG
jgi:hypothetical protein